MSTSMQVQRWTGYYTILAHSVPVPQREVDVHRVFITGVEIWKIILFVSLEMLCGGNGTGSGDAEGSSCANGGFCNLPNLS